MGWEPRTHVLTLGEKEKARQKNGGLLVCLNAFDNPSSRRIGTQDKSDEI